MLLLLQSCGLVHVMGLHALLWWLLLFSELLVMVLTECAEATPAGLQNCCCDLTQARQPHCEADACRGIDMLYDDVS